MEIESIIDTIKHNPEISLYYVLKRRMSDMSELGREHLKTLGDYLLSGLKAVDDEHALQIRFTKWEQPLRDEFARLYDGVGASSQKEKEGMYAEAMLAQSLLGLYALALQATLNLMGRDYCVQMAQSSAEFIAQAIGSVAQKEPIPGFKIDTAWAEIKDDFSSIPPSPCGLTLVSKILQEQGGDQRLKKVLTLIAEQIA